MVDGRWWAGGWASGFVAIDACHVFWSFEFCLLDHCACNNLEHVVGDAAYELSTLRLLYVLLQEVVGVSFRWCVGGWIGGWVGEGVGTWMTVFVPVGDGPVIDFGYYLFCALYRPRFGIFQRTTSK